MARGINKVTLVGYVGADPQALRFTPSGTAVAVLSIATHESWIDRGTNERQERTEWHNVVLFNKLAEISTEYVKKGALVYVEGKLRARKWTDRSAIERYTTDIVAHQMQMLSQRMRSEREEVDSPVPPVLGDPLPDEAALADDDIPF